jgi:hypothetical protein
MDTLPCERAPQAAGYHGNRGEKLSLGEEHQLVIDHGWESEPGMNCHDFVCVNWQMSQIKTVCLMSE